MPVPPYSCFVGLAAALLARESRLAQPRTIQRAAQSAPLKRLLYTAQGAFLEFFKRDAALAILVFVVLFKLCDALAGAMTAPFILSLSAATKSEYVAIVKGVGLAALLAGGFAGGAVARAYLCLTLYGLRPLFRCYPIWCSCGLHRKRRALGP